MKIFAHFLLIFMMTAGWSPSAKAAECTNASARQSAIWLAFDEYVTTTYRIKNPDKSDEEWYAYAYGHALGRLASAVNGQPERETGFSCVDIGLQQINAFKDYFGGKSYYAEIQAASYGKHDDIVRERFGVTATDPLYAVFEAAERYAGDRGSGSGSGSGTSPIGGSTSSSGSLYTPLPSPGPRQNGRNSNCTSGDRWSLTAAREFLTSANFKSQVLTSDCTGNNWLICQDIMDDLIKAQDHIFQVFDRNHDGVNNCRLCNYNAAIDMAKSLVNWEKWLRDRYYRSASGLGNIYYTIQDNQHDPLCRITTPPIRIRQPDRPVTPPDLMPVRPPKPRKEKHICANSEIPIDANWKFYTTGRGGGRVSYPEKRGLICYGNNNYDALDGSSFSGHHCTGDWQNCQPVASGYKPFVSSYVMGDGSTSYYYGDEKSWGNRMPKR
jgi:hypothetical protein